MYGLDQYASLPKESLSKEITKSFTNAETMARLSVQFIGRLYYATSDNQYLHLIEQASNSENGQVRGMANSYINETLKKEWESGKYELFAWTKETFKPNKERPTTPVTGGTRARKANN